MSRLDHGTGSGIPLLWSCTQKVRFVHDVGLYGCWQYHQLPMVLLGLFSHVLGYGNQRVYWRFEAFWSEACSGSPKSRFASCFGPALFLLPGNLKPLKSICGII